MSEHELEKLLGGFAADTLTAEEKQRLYATALHDQQLFNALADEQTLKDLLADPIVRQRLLRAVNQTGTRGAGIWLHWFRRPSGLAWAGGLAVAVFAVVLGTKVYQDGVRQAAQSVAIEETKPAAPPTPAPPISQPASTAPAEPASQAETNETPAKDTAMPDALLDKMAKRERVAPPAMQQQKAPETVGDLRSQRRERDEARKQADMPVTELKSPDGVSASVDQKLAAGSAPPASIPAPVPTQAPTGAAAGAAIAPAPGARALFYAADMDRADQKTTEREQSMKSAPEARRSLRPESKMERFEAAGVPSPLKPLGLRYGFAIRATDGTAQETDAATALKGGERARLTIEVNQEAYVQIWKTAGSPTPELWFPTKETGLISMKVPAGRRQGIPLTEVDETSTLVVRLSRVPLGPITEQEAAALAMPSNQLQETITPHDAIGSQEQATYVVNQNLSPTVQLMVEIPLGRKR